MPPTTGRFESTYRQIIQSSPHRRPVFHFEDSAIYVRIHAAGNKRLCIETDTRGPRVTDAWYAALAIEWGCEWITFDRDYARFPGLKWQVPARV